MKLIEQMRVDVDSYSNTFAELRDAVYAKQKATNLEEERPFFLWLMGVREMVVSWSLFSDEEDVIDLFKKITTHEDKGIQTRRLEWLLNGTTRLLSNFTEDEFAEASEQLAVAISWVRSSTLLPDNLIEDSGDIEFFRDMFKTAPWTVFVYLFVTNEGRSFG